MLIKCKWNRSTVGNSGPPLELIARVIWFTSVCLISARRRNGPPNQKSICVAAQVSARSRVSEFSWADRQRQATHVCMFLFVFVGGVILCYAGKAAGGRNELMGMFCFPLEEGMGGIGWQGLEGLELGWFVFFYSDGVPTCSSSCNVRVIRLTLGVHTFYYPWP